MRLTCISVLAAGALSSTAFGQLTINWFTIDGGGGTSTGGTFTLSGTIGQCDAVLSLAGGTFVLTGGFWAGIGQPTCRADFNHDGQVDFFDYLDFVQAFAAEDASADYNHDGQVDFFDYLDFIADFAAGC